MTSHIASGATVYVPVTDQDKSVFFFVESLGFESRADFTFGDGARWVEVAAPGSDVQFSLVTGRPTGIETGIALGADDVEAAHADYVARGLDADPAILREGDQPIEWAGAALAGIPPMFRLRDPDGNSFLIVQR